MVGLEFTYIECKPVCSANYIDSNPASIKIKISNEFKERKYIVKYLGITVD